MVCNPDDRRTLPRADGSTSPQHFNASPSPNLEFNQQAKPLLFGANNAAPILVSDGEKGGIGKSHLKRLLAYLLSVHSIRWAGFDLDPRNSHLERFHRKFDVTRLDWNYPAAWEHLYQGIMQLDNSKAVLIDLPAQCGPVTKDEYPRLVRTASHLGRTVLRFWTLTHEFDSVNLLAQSMSAIDCNNTFAVLNLRNANRGDFELWNSSNTRKSLLSAGGTEIYMPRLPAAVANKIEAENLSFFDAASSLSEPWLQYDIESYLSVVETEFAPVSARLA